MNTVEVLWEVIIVKRQFWQRVANNYLGLDCVLGEGGYSSSSRGPLPYVMVEMRTLERFYHTGFSFPFSRAKIRSSQHWITHLCLEYIKFCLHAFVEIFFSH